MISSKEVVTEVRQRQTQNVLKNSYISISFQKIPNLQYQNKPLFFPDKTIYTAESVCSVIILSLCSYLCLI